MTHTVIEHSGRSESLSLSHKIRKGTKWMTGYLLTPSGLLVSIVDAQYIRPWYFDWALGPALISLILTVVLHIPTTSPTSVVYLYSKFTTSESTIFLKPFESRTPGYCLTYTQATWVIQAAYPPHSSDPTILHLLDCTKDNHLHHTIKSGHQTTTPQLI